MIRTTKKPGFMLSLSPVLLLIALLVINILIFKDDATGGANQLALLVSGLYTAFVGVAALKVGYKKIEDRVISQISLSLQACLILLIVGSLIGTWILSGIVPAMIYYGLQIINPTVFLPVACLVCAIVSLATGSSWSTTGTIGIALIGIGTTLNIPAGMIAGAVISGAYFGDKMSPLSDTTNLAPAMAGTDLFTHIKHMTYTSGPAMIMSLIGFTILGFTVGTGETSTESISAILSVIEKNFSLGLHLFLAPIVVLVLVAKKIDALPALCIGVLAGVLSAVLFQQDLLIRMIGHELTIKSVYKEVVAVAYGGFSIESGNKVIDSLFNRGGMSSMLNTVWLIIMAMFFGGSLEATGMLDVLAKSVLKLVSGTGSLIGATLGSCLVLNATASDQYLAIVVPGRMFKKAYDDYGLHPKNLSRALEDAGTVTSVLIPWNSGGAYNAGVLGVATLTYLPFCFFNILSPFVSLFLASMNWTIEKKLKESQA